MSNSKSIAHVKVFQIHFKGNYTLNKFEEKSNMPGFIWLKDIGHRLTLPLPLTLNLKGI